MLAKEPAGTTLTISERSDPGSSGFWDAAL
jgi:hypothetical protein